MKKNLTDPYVVSGLSVDRNAGETDVQVAMTLTVGGVQASPQYVPDDIRQAVADWAGAPPQSMEGPLRLLGYGIVILLLGLGAVGLAALVTWLP